MHDVRAPQLVEEHGPVGELRDNGADVLHAERGPQRTRRHRVDRHEPRADVRIVAPGAEETLGLHRLAAEDVHRRRDDGDVEAARGRLGHLGSALSCIRSQLCKGRAAAIVLFADDAVAIVALSCASRLPAGCCRTQLSGIAYLTDWRGFSCTACKNFKRMSCVRATLLSRKSRR